MQHIPLVDGILSDMLIAQISDTHISTPGSRNDALLRTDIHLLRAVEHLNAQKPRPDCVLITGDLVERGHPDEYGRLHEILHTLAMPLFVIPGNHDAREPLARTFAHLPNNGSFLQYTVEDWPVRLIGLDTLLPGQPSGQLCSERLAWLEARLAEAPLRPTLVFMHHPPFDTGITAMDAMGLAGREAFAEIISRYPRVERVVCGHVHRPLTRRFAGTIASVCPSTAHQVALTLQPATDLSLVMEPPATTLHLWLGETDGIVSHLSPIGSRPRHTVYDGTAWNDSDELPPGFHPTP